MQLAASFLVTHAAADEIVERGQAHDLHATGCAAELLTHRPR